jgi:hypothetical protein
MNHLNNENPKFSLFGVDETELALSVRAEKHVILTGYMQIVAYVKAEKHGNFLLKFSPYTITNQNENVQKNEQNVMMIRDTASMWAGW